VKEILIKKYDNRRLYCVEEARYVSLSEIREFLQRGDRVKVIEKSTGKDITKYILMQVLLEERYELLPINFYQMILQSPKDVVENFFKRFFPWMMNMYENYQQGNTFPGMPTMPNMGFQNPWMQNNPFGFNNPFMSGKKQQKPKDSSKSAAQQKPDNAAKQQEPEEPATDNDKMAEILKRLQELESKLQSED
jgi:polyhydroxyalkanoate synthesis repressor PhaR